MWLTMKEMPAKDAKNQFGQLLDAAQRSPVRVTRHGRGVAVMMSEVQYQHLRGLAWDRLASTIDALRGEVADSGLTEEQLAALLADES